MTHKTPENIPLYLRRARLDAGLMALRVERQTLPMSAIVRKMQIGARMLAIGNELASLRQRSARRG